MKNFIFDVDRTLVDSYAIEFETLKESLFLVLGKSFNPAMMNSLTTLTTDDFFKKIGLANNKEVLKQVNKNWASLLTERKITFFEGIKEQLFLLKNKNCFLGIATSRNTSELEELKDLMQIISMFDCVVTSDMISKPKPDPESIHYILKQYQLKKNETIYIGDSVSDWIAAKKAGISFGYACWENENQPITESILLDNPKQIINLYQQ